MEEKNSEKLFDTFKTFLEKETLSDGIKCENGWYQILFNMCTAIETTNPPKNFRITKIFERYGQLSIHSVGGTCATRLHMDEAIDLSFDICQFCGNNINLQKCDKCKDTNLDTSDYDPDIKAAVALPEKDEEKQI